MKLGIAREVPPLIPADLKSAISIVATWSRFSGRHIPDFNQFRGVSPLIYMETQTWGQPDTYKRILAGEFDEYLSNWANAAAQYRKPIIASLDQEVNSTFFPWGKPGQREDFVEVFTYVGTRLRAIAPNIQMMYRPILRRREFMPLIKKYYPGDACQVVGWDAYSKSVVPVPLNKQWKGISAEFNRIAPGKPQVVGEFGRFRHLGEKEKWLATLKDVTGVFAVIYFDVRVLIPELNLDHDWRMTKGMRTVYSQIGD